MKKAIKIYIIEKAKQILSKKGFNNTTMDEIAELADISKPTLYKYFSSKEELFIQVLISINDDVDKMIIDSIDINNKASDSLKIVIIKTLEFLKKHQSIMKMALFESKDFIKHSKDKNCHIKNFIKNRERRKKFLEKIIRKGQKSGEIRDDISPKQLSVLFMGTIKEFGFEIIFLDYEENNMEILAENITNIIINGIKRR